MPGLLVQVFLAALPIFAMQPGNTVPVKATIAIMEVQGVIIAREVVMVQIPVIML